jgi:hypothetical protein
MKKSILLKSIVAGLLMLAVATPPMTLAAAGDKAETITGEGKCGKCAKKLKNVKNVIKWKRTARRSVTIWRRREEQGP